MVFSQLMQDCRDQHEPRQPARRRPIGRPVQAAPPGHDPDSSSGGDRRIGVSNYRYAGPPV
jgi:hypothetical protein